MNSGDKHFFLSLPCSLSCSLSPSCSLSLLPHLSSALEKQPATNSSFEIVECVPMCTLLTVIAFRSSPWPFYFVKVSGVILILADRFGGDGVL